MTHFVVKVLVTALVVTVSSEISKRSTTWGAILASLPLTSILVLSWLHLDTKDSAKVSSLSTGIFWAVLPSLLFFLVLPFLLKRGWGYWPALGASSAAMFAGYTAYAALLGRLGVTL